MRTILDWNYIDETKVIDWRGTTRTKRLSPKQAKARALKIYKHICRTCKIYYPVFIRQENGLLKHCSGHFSIEINQRVFGLPWQETSKMVRFKLSDFQE